MCMSILLYIFVSKKTTKEQTYDYFKKFGEIKNVRLMNDRKHKNVHYQQATKIGFVNFCDATVAAK